MRVGIVVVGRLSAGIDRVAGAGLRDAVMVFPRHTGQAVIGVVSVFGRFAGRNGRALQAVVAGIGHCPDVEQRIFHRQHIAVVVEAEQPDFSPLVRYLLATS